MLETEEVDDDFFTPVASTSLANIFGSITSTNERAENDTLKYVPPKPQNTVPKKISPARTTECVFACVLVAHEWCNNVYTSKGKLGFAIIKIQKSGDHNIVLYDSNKTTLSNTVITPQLEVTIKNNAYISFYDNLQKYWSIYGTSEEVKKIDNLLKSLGAIINYSNHTDNEPLQPNNSQSEPTNSLEDSAHQNRGSDTDSSVNRKTKATILSRMANMGHSVLPTRNLQVHRSSDSSDTNEIDTQTKAVRHKPSKPYIKKNIIDNNMSDHQQITESNQRLVVANTEPEKNIALFNRHATLLSNTGVIANSSNELSMFMTEQRISNSELRINLNRVTDKLDTVLNKINTQESKDSHSNVSTDILLKLLTEYENKIKVYEEMLKSKGMIGTKGTDDQQATSQEADILKRKILELENINADKENVICNLQKEITLLREVHCQDKNLQTRRERDLMMEINNLEGSLEEKTKQIIEFSNTELSHDDIQDKVKNIMNNTFQTISTNFEDSDVYTGEAIKKTVGTVIKKITINMLHEFKQN